MNNNNNALVSRNQWEGYMDVGSAGAVENELIGEGFTSFSESKNPKEYSRHYVHEKTERTDVMGYASSISYSADVYSENAVIGKIIEVTDKELTGTDAQVTITLVNKWESSTNGDYIAYQRRYSIIPDGKGDGTDALIYTGTLKAVGDAVAGTWNADTKTFTANTAPGSSATESESGES